TRIHQSGAGASAPPSRGCYCRRSCVGLARLPWLLLRPLLLRRASSDRICATSWAAGSRNRRVYASSGVIVSMETGSWWWLADDWLDEPVDGRADASFKWAQPTRRAGDLPA